MLSYFPRDVLDAIIDLIESVSEGFPTYSLTLKSNASVLTELKSTSHTFAHDEIKARS